MKKYLIILILLFSGVAYAQETPKDTNTRKGEFSFGVRTTGSLFSATGNYFGIGTGWHARYRLADKTNTEWFADWIITDIGGLGQRYDMHIGESMVIYPGRKVSQKGRFTPYILGGFCGDYTKLTSNLYYDNTLNTFIQKSEDRWSFATQLGLGTHYNVAERFDFSFTVQYVLHFGKDLDAEAGTNSAGVEYLRIPDEKGSALEGHAFFTISANYVIADFSKK